LRNILLASTFLGFLPVLYLSNYMDWGLTGIWAAIIVWVAWRGVALMIKYYKKYLPLAS
jgi:MATE family multidrug resistance protein